MNIEGRTILVTGASRGLGRTLVFAFAKAGAQEVFAGARKAEDIEHDLHDLEGQEYGQLATIMKRVVRH